MNVVSNSKGGSSKRVVIQFVANESDEAIVALALTVARETQSSVFGTRVERHDDDSATVTLFTD